MDTIDIVVVFSIDAANDSVVLLLPRKPHGGLLWTCRCSLCALQAFARALFAPSVTRAKQELIPFACHPAAPHGYVRQRALGVKVSRLCTQVGEKQSVGMLPRNVGKLRRKMGKKHNTGMQEVG